MNKHGKELLSVWEPQIKYSKTLSPGLQAVMLDGVEKLNIEYDGSMDLGELNDDGLTSAEKEKNLEARTIFINYALETKIQFRRVQLKSIM
ncbi:MAG: hypothetical protein MZW92_06355 [Comamonadaceae bacterium]|nr:hypothetical protein [Comamonadaceae bacterium]